MGSAKKRTVTYEMTVTVEVESDATDDDVKSAISGLLDTEIQRRWAEGPLRAKTAGLKPIEVTFQNMYDLRVRKQGSR